MLVVPVVGAASVSPYLAGGVSAVAVVVAAVVPAYLSSRAATKATATSAAMDVIEEARNGLKELANQRAADNEAINRRLDECLNREKELRDKMQEAEDKHQTELIRLHRRLSALERQQPT